MKTALALFLVAALIGCAVTLPGYLLNRQEARLYQTVAQSTALYTQFEVTDSTLSQRLSAAGSLTVLDFSVGAKLYWDEAEMREQFLAELDRLTQWVPALGEYTAWVHQVAEPSAGGDGLYGILQYLCGVDASTGQTYLFGQLEIISGGWTKLMMDLPTGKLVCLQCDMPQVYGEAGIASPEEMAGGYAGYLGMENLGVSLWAGQWGVYQFQDQAQTILAEVGIAQGNLLTLSLMRQ